MWLNISETETKTDTPKKVIDFDTVTLRNYPKVIFFYPLFFTSLILWLLQLAITQGGTPIALFGFIWMIVFFINLVIIGFDFSSTKFFILLLIVIIFVLLFFFLVLPNITIEAIPLPREYNIEMTDQFYLVTTLLLGFILLIVIISTRFDYWIIERNEIYHKKGILADADRYPTGSLKLKKEITDVFEFFILKAGSLKLYVKGDDFRLPTVLNINKKIEKINTLLSHLEVEIEDINNK